MNQEDHYLIKCKQAKLSTAQIAKRLSLTVQQVEDRWKKILEDVQQKETNGYIALSDDFTNLCNQYQLLGESLKSIGAALGNVMSQEELETLLDSDPKCTLHNLNQFAIVLKPYTSPNPQALSERLEGTKRKES